MHFPQISTCLNSKSLCYSNLPQQYVLLYIVYCGGMMKHICCTFQQNIILQWHMAHEREYFH